ncbi:MAG: hypothetical protein IKM43_00210 [Clostridia bacterium]|nr:hypothetical protein [Clostridia bacterium]
MSETETRNALNTYLEYFLLTYGLDNDYYDITIHADKDINKNKLYLAYVVPHHKYENKYDVYLNKTHMKMKEETDLPLLIHMFISASHEFKHIVQFETTPSITAKSEINYCEVCEKCDEFQKSKDTKTKSLLNRLKYILETNSVTEKDADASAFYVFEYALRLLQARADSYTYFNFLELCCDIVKDFHKNRKRLWKMQYEDYIKVARDMKKIHDVTISLD